MVKVYDPSTDGMIDVTQEWLDTVQKLSRRMNNRNVIIKLVSQLNVTNEADMDVLVKLASLLENRNISNA